MMKLLSQFEQVERATPLARREEGKISAVVSSIPLEWGRGCASRHTRRKSPGYRTP